jgi:DNA polymerase-3 subunit gamma/tau
VPDVVEAAAASGAVAVAEAPAGTLDLATVGELWPAVLDTVRERHAMLGTVLAAARPVAVADRAVTLAFDPSQTFLRRKAEDPACRELVQEAFRALLGVSPRLEFELRDRSEEENGAGAPALSEDEWVSRFKQAFDAEEIVPEDGEDQA